MGPTDDISTAEHSPPRICIMICTFNRPARLRILLDALQPQVAACDALVLIIDNGTQSCEDVVAAFAGSMTVTYAREPSAGLVFARNTALRLALAQTPDYLVFIDDDEVPEPQWLSRLVQTMTDTGADFATGPVEPDYGVPPPAWAVAGGYFHASANSFRTSNLILRRTSLPHDEAQWFHPWFNFTGGEDDEFLSRLVAHGARQALAPDALVHEFIPAERLRRCYIWRRGLRDGISFAQIAKLRAESRAGFAARLAMKCLQKLGYAANHLFWSPWQPWRINSMMGDILAAAGMLGSVLGAAPRFYGNAGSETKTPGREKNKDRLL